MKTAFLFLVMSLNACRATAPAPVVETVGALVDTGSSVRSAPVAATTDLSIAYNAVDSDETPTAADVGERDVKPEVAAKVAHGF